MTQGGNDTAQRAVPDRRKARSMAGGRRAATLRLRAIEIGRYSDEAAMVSAGLRPGERIVVAGVHKLAAGQKIRVAERASDAMPAPIAARATTPAVTQ